MSYWSENSLSSSFYCVWLCLRKTATPRLPRWTLAREAQTHLWKCFRYQRKPLYAIYHIFPSDLEHYLYSYPDPSVSYWCLRSSLDVCDSSVTSVHHFLSVLTPLSGIYSAPQPTDPLTVHLMGQVSQFAMLVNSPHSTSNSPIWVKTDIESALQSALHHLTNNIPHNVPQIYLQLHKKFKALSRLWMTGMHEGQTSINWRNIFPTL